MAKVPGLQSNKFDEIEQVIDLAEYFDPDEINEPLKLRFGQAVVDRIRERTRSNKDVNGGSFKGYSKEYKDSLQFQARGKSDKVNLYLTGDMQRSLDVENMDGTLIRITFDDSDEEAKATNHNFGVSKGMPKREWFGATRTELEDIASGFDVATSTNASSLLDAIKEVASIADLFRRL